MQRSMNEPPEDPRVPPKDQEMIEALTKALDRMIVDQSTENRYQIDFTMFILRFNLNRGR
jgi:hypothetical protein